MIAFGLPYVACYFGACIADVRSLYPEMKRTHLYLVSLPVTLVTVGILLSTVTVSVPVDGTSGTIREYCCGHTRSIGGFGLFSRHVDVLRHSSPGHFREAPRRQPLSVGCVQLPLFQSVDRSHRRLSGSAADAARVLDDVRARRWGAKPPSAPRTIEKKIQDLIKRPRHTKTVVAKPIAGAEPVARSGTRAPRPVGEWVFR